MVIWLSKQGPRRSCQFSATKGHGPRWAHRRGPGADIGSRTRPKRWPKAAEEDGGNAWRAVFSPARFLSLKAPRSAATRSKIAHVALPATRSLVMRQPAVRLRLDLVGIAADDKRLRKWAHRDPFAPSLSPACAIGR